jgi:AcrR family transcriptional regulator
MPASQEKTSGVVAVSRRERRKEHLRRAIQEDALQLFESRGYEETTVEQIADSADISPRTFFRYFASKEAVVVFWPEYPQHLTHFVGGRPKDEPAVKAIQLGISDGLAAFDARDRELLLRCSRLAFRARTLHAALGREQAGMARVIGSALAERLGRDAADLRVLAVASAIAAAVYVALEDWQARDGIDDLGQLINHAFASLDDEFGKP